MDRPVSICATGCVCAAGNDTESCFQTMLSGQTAPAFNHLFSYSEEMGGPVFSVRKDWQDHNSGKAPTGTMDFLFRATDEALQQAEITPEILEKFTVGTCIGSSTGASLDFKSFYHQWRKGEEKDLSAIKNYTKSNPATALSARHNLNGPMQTVTNACSSGTDAIGIGASWIRLGLCDIVIAGGADALSGISHTGFSRLMITSPETCKPFDRNRKGLNLGEGAAVLILASDTVFKTLKLSPLAAILGYGTCSDAHHMTAPHPEGRGLKAAISEALQRSGLKQSDIDFINVHGTGTNTNDLVESKVINELFHGKPFTGVKGFTGHTLGAAGAIEAVMTIKSLECGELTPCAGFENEDPDIGTSPITQPLKINARYGLSDSLAFGGNNSAIVIKKVGK